MLLNRHCDFENHSLHVEFRLRFLLDDAMRQETFERVGGRVQQEAVVVGLDRDFIDAANLRKVELCDQDLTVELVGVGEKTMFGLVYVGNGFARLVQSWSVDFLDKHFARLLIGFDWVDLDFIFVISARHIESILLSCVKLLNGLHITIVDLVLNELIDAGSILQKNEVLSVDLNLILLFKRFEDERNQKVVEQTVGSANLLGIELGVHGNITNVDFLARLVFALSRLCH